MVELQASCKPVAYIRTLSWWRKMTHFVP
jgi:hypothetical protein